MVDLGLLAFAFALGLGTFFSPCSAALLPAYVAFFAGTKPAIEQDTARGGTLLRGLRFAAVAAVGILAVFALFGAVIYMLRRIFHLRSEWLGIGLTTLALGVALVLVVLGILMLLGRGPTLTPRLRAPTVKTLPAMFLFGALYAFASLGCTLPLFFAVLAQVLLVGPVGGSLLIAAFAVGFAGLMFLATLVLSLAQDRARHLLGRVMPFVRPVAGVVLILAGGYIVSYYSVIAPAF